MFAQSNFGTVSLQYQMSDQPLFGEWYIRVEALGQIEETQFLVEEYYQTRYEVSTRLDHVVRSNQSSNVQ